MVFIPESYRSFIHKSKTATADTPFRVTDQSIPFYEANIHCLTNNAYYGDMTGQEAPLFAGDVAYFPKGDIKDIWFKNYTGGSNTKIVIVAVIPVEYVTKALAAPKGV